ncbi:sensor histidine kinase [Thalassobacillus hwangdonensis]|uniref:histidine kinase n=1 Tax=Thalassobacillus hwangdonensis TaxID=546108 RepID=A0ABW3L5E2_9BACI
MKDNSIFHRKRTLITQFTKSYSLHFVIALLLIGIAVLIGVSFFLFQNVQDEREVVEEKLQDVTTENQLNWQSTLDEVLYPDHPDFFVEVAFEGKAIAQSRDWEDMIEDEDQSEVLGSSHWIWNEDEGLFYKTDANAGSGSSYTLFIHLEDEVEFLTLIAQILFFVGLTSLIVGSILIHQFTKKSLQPLLSITDAVGRMKGTGDLNERIPVPGQPYELQQLGTKFNTLLEQIEDQFEREKSFVANASHELRTPLTSFRGHLNLLRRWGKKDLEVLDQSIHALSEESDRMERMMEQMLMIARNEHQQIRREKVDLSILVREAVEQFQPRDHVKFEKHIEEQVCVDGDKDQIRQIAVILLENAIRYTEEGKIRISLYDNGEKAVLQISDTGIGIPEEDQDKIFDRFYRVDKNRSRATGGTGLGLSIARQLVENHNGHIHLSSKEDEGSTFTVHLPTGDSPSAL